jgi:hypothetical protein
MIIFFAFIILFEWITFYRYAQRNHKIVHKGSYMHTRNALVREYLIGVAMRSLIWILIGVTI